MRVREFIVRTGFFLPVTVFGILVFIMVFGMTANLLGAQSILSASFYCKGCMALITLGMAAVIFWQVFDCCKEKQTVKISKKN